MTMTISLDQQKTRRIYDLNRPAVNQRNQGLTGQAFTEDPDDVAVICIPDFGLTLTIPFDQITLFTPRYCGGGLDQNERFAGAPVGEDKAARLCLLNQSQVTFTVGPRTSVDEPNRRFRIQYDEFGIILEGSLDQIELAPVPSPPPTRFF